ncbi:MAG: flagellar basal body L-ring protein FlgH [Bacteroidales bacterium]
MYNILIFILFLTLFLINGCTTTTETKRFIPWDVEREILSTSRPSYSKNEEGSIWSDNCPQLLYADLKAKNIGDIITINIVERATASKNAETKTDRESGAEADWSGLFKLITQGWEIHKTPIGTDHKINFRNSFDGKGETTRSSYMNAFITARVIHVLPNGNLVIRGSRQVKLNNENQFIFVQGVVRPEDISSNNTVLSTYIADAVIELTGSGIISDKQRPGWLMRLVDWIWPF